MVTAKDLPEEKCKGFIAGMDDYMVKPVNEEEMLLRIKALLQGPKIPAETAAHIFEKFYQGDSSHTTDENGLGFPLQSASWSYMAEPFG